MEEKKSLVAEEETEEKVSTRNFLGFTVGSFGREFLYAFFSGYLLTFILFTKTLTDAQFACVSIIIISARIFDAFNDPIMGGIVENTRSRWGKFRPWIFIGAVSTAVVVSLVFSIDVDGWGFIGFLAVMYLLFSVTFTMNDISFWGLLPALGRRDHDRNRLMSIESIIAGCGSALVGVVVPAVTTTYSRFFGGSAQVAYKWMAIIAGVLIIVFQTFTSVVIRDSSCFIREDVKKEKAKLSIKDMFRVIKDNDQLLISTLLLTMYSVSTGVVSGGLSTTYIYFEFGYNGLLTTIFGLVSGFFSTVFTWTFPYLLKRIPRKRIITFGAIATVIGYFIMMLIGIFVPTGSPIATVMELPIYTKFIFLMIANGIVGIGQCSFYMLTFLNIANTVEYNEWKTGKREESLIFSLRPFSAKLSSALSQLLVTLVYMGVGVLSVTNGISSLDNATTKGQITNAEMLLQVDNLLKTVPTWQKQALVGCMCIIPIVFMSIAIVIFRKKFFLDEKTHSKMKEEIRLRKLEESLSQNTEEVVLSKEGRV